MEKICEVCKGKFYTFTPETQSVCSRHCFEKQKDAYAIRKGWGRCNTWYNSMSFEQIATWGDNISKGMKSARAKRQAGD